ncbi:MAG: hypothetical protein SO049_02175, partial [Prevotella sp.]|nr:hypothetical protein [Prevotella sp.]
TQQQGRRGMEFSEYSEKDMKDGKEPDTLHTPYTSNNSLSLQPHHDDIRSICDTPRVQAQ